MTYSVLGRAIEIYSIILIESEFSKFFEIEGNNILKQIGLNEKFWFQLPDHFTNDYPKTEEDFASEPKYLSQRVLADYLQEAISKKVFS